MRREAKYVDYPEYEEKYLLIGGKVYINIRGQDGKKIGRFLRERREEGVEIHHAHE